MKKISAEKTTFFYKRIFPIFWFGFLIVFFVFSLRTGALEEDKMFLLMPLIMGLGGFFMMKKFVWDLVDEVYDCGSYLLIKNNGVEERIDFQKIMNVNYIQFMNPPRVTLMIKSSNSQPNRDISFTPPSRINFFSKDPLVEDLIQRADQARVRGSR